MLGLIVVSRDWTKEPKERSYTNPANDGYFSLVLPVQLPDLQQAIKDDVLDCYNYAIGKGEYQTIHLKLPIDRLRELASKFPKSCGMCGFDRFQFLTISYEGAGYEASFTCPRCGETLELNWKDNW